MTAASQTFTSPVGRFVGGDLFTPRTKDLSGKPMVTQKGEPRTEYIVQVAFPKSDPATNELLQKIMQAAMEGFPTLFQNGQCLVPTFSYKCIDGDSAVPNQRGVKPCDREGFPGNWVVTFKGSFAPKIYDARQVPIVDPKAVKRGDYVRVAATCRANGQMMKPGVYINPSMVQVCGYGEEIRTGPDPATAFAAPAALPAGASTTPTAPTSPMPGMGMPGASAPMPGMGMGAPMPGMGMGAPMPGMPMPGASAVAPMPAPGFGAMPPAPPPAAPQLKNTPHTYEQLRAAGWTDDQMRQMGYL